MDGSMVVLLVDRMGHGGPAGGRVDGDRWGPGGTAGIDGSTMTLLAGRAVLDTVMVDGHAGWKGVLLAALDEDTVVLLDGI